jgi:hypothetical protein
MQNLVRHRVMSPCKIRFSTLGDLPLVVVIIFSSSIIISPILLSFLLLTMVRLYECNGCGTKGVVPSCTIQELIIFQTGENSCWRSIEISCIVFHKQGAKKKKSGASVLIQIEK